MEARKKEPTYVKVLGPNGSSTSQKFVAKKQGRVRPKRRQTCLRMNS